MKPDNRQSRIGIKIQPGSQSGSVRGIVLLLIIVAVLMWKGVQDLYVALANRQPTAMSFKDYLQSTPKARWLTLTNCVLDLTETSYREGIGGAKPVELFVPVRESAEADGEIQLLFATTHPGYISTCVEMQNLKSESEALIWAFKNRDRLFPTRDITGLVRSGFDLDDKDREKLSEVQPNLKEDFVVLDDGSKPSLVSGLGLSGGGIMLLLGGVLYLRKNREPRAAQP